MNAQTRQQAEAARVIPTTFRPPWIPLCRTESLSRALSSAFIFALHIHVRVPYAPCSHVCHVLAIPLRLLPTLDTDAQAMKLPRFSSSRCSSARYVKVFVLQIRTNNAGRNPVIRNIYRVEESRLNLVYKDRELWVVYKLTCSMRESFYDY